ncbi:MAG: ABC transporter substrate-binding protein [Sedimentisphaerales bacterium]|nr:ABC transporter substrate-binding protein [Sedimentisphaerales bacterium]
MARWWLLSILLATWLALGCLLFPLRRADAVSEAPAATAPTRIVSAAPNLTEILFALGLDEQIAGVTRGSNYPPAAAQKPTVGTFWQPNIETVIATRPDLVVLLTFPQQQSLADRLRRLGIHCLTLEIWTVDDLFDAIAMLGQATGRAQDAQRLLAETKTRIERLQTRLAGKRRTKVLWVVQRDPLRVAGRNTFVNELIDLAGGENAIGSTLHKYPPIGGEQILACGAEVIIEPAMMPGLIEAQRAQALAYWQRFANVPAVADGRIHVIDGDIVSRLGPRLYEAVETIAKCLRPELVGE